MAEGLATADHHDAGTARQPRRASAVERPLRPRHRVRIRRHVRADPVPVAACDSRAASGDRSPGGSRPRPALGPGERPVDRSGDARRRRGPANLPSEDRKLAAPRFRRSNRGRADRPRPTHCRWSISSLNYFRSAWRAVKRAPTGVIGRSRRRSSLMRSTTFATCLTWPITWLLGSRSLDASSGPRRSSRNSSNRWRGGRPKIDGGGCRGCSHLGRRCLEMARRLADWREDEARRLNRPMRQVLRDDLLVAIAKRQPTNRRGLEALRDFNRPALLKRSQEILAILDEARAVPEDQLPELAPRHEEPPGLSTVTNLALRGAGTVLRTEPDLGIDRGERRRSERAGPLVRRGPRSVSSSRAA